MNAREKNRITELALKSIDGQISKEEFEELDSYVSSSDENAQCFTNCIATYMGITSYYEINHQNYFDNSSFDEELWREMAEYEKYASALDIAKGKPEKELIQKVVYPTKEKRKLGTFSKVFLVMNAAAILFFVLFLRFVPPKGGIEVATLMDSINAKWVDVDTSMQRGTRLCADKTEFMLRVGLAELKFDNNTRITVEGPAEFQLLAEDRIGLNYGRVYAIVPKEAIGFSVYTQNAKIVDMGTEFGVHAEIGGDTQLHVLKGKTMLMAGEKDSKVSMEVAKGAAKKISSDSQTVTDIPCNEKYFVREFDSANKAVWREQPSLDLADIAGGGNGLGTGQSNVMIHPAKDSTEVLSAIFSTSKEYRPLPENPFVDGVFAPDGSAGQVISSRGDVFRECPKTSGLFDNQIVVNPKPGLYTTRQREGTIRFDGQVYAVGGKPCIVMHSNLGLTFDLDAIRKNYHRDIHRFTSRIGIADLNEKCLCNADFWVLVDGQVRYSLEQYKQKGVLNDVSVEISDTDRFLTLVATDGGDPDYPKGGFYKRAISCDWCVFTEPILVLE